MKSFFVNTLIFSCLIINFLSAQIEEPLVCSVGTESFSYQGQIGGYALSSEGTMNVLIVFCQFPDDNYVVNDSYWVKGQAPANMNEWVNQTWTSDPIEGSLTHYFNSMSFNNFKFIGKTVSVTSPHSRQWYYGQQQEKRFYSQRDNTAA